MKARADWHAAELAVDVDVDALFEPAERIEEVGVPIPLAGDLAALAAELVELVHRERAMSARCAVKRMADTSCSACPIAGRYGELCELGRRQEAILTLLAVLERGG